MPLARTLSYFLPVLFGSVLSTPVPGQTLVHKAGFAVWFVNTPDLNFLVRLEGDSIMPTDHPTIVAVDGTPVQIAVIATSKFTMATAPKKMLEDFFAYESGYMRETMSKDLAFHQEMLRLENKQDALFWSYDMPKLEAVDPAREATGHLFLNTICKDYMIGLNIVLFAEDDPKKQKARLLRIANSLTLSDVPFTEAMIDAIH
ncbi:MAG: hypothetical protein ABI432_03475 [Flavobacteriales bacterium]